MGVSASCIKVSLFKLCGSVTVTVVVLYGIGEMMGGGGASSQLFCTAEGLVATIEKSLAGGLDVGRWLSFAIWGFVKISRKSGFPKSPISGHFEEVLKIGQFMSEEG